MFCPLKVYNNLEGALYLEVVNYLEGTFYLEVTFYLRGRKCLPGNIYIQEADYYLRETTSKIHGSLPARLD